MWQLYLPVVALSVSDVAYVINAAESRVCFRIATSMCSVGLMQHEVRVSTVLALFSSSSSSWVPFVIFETGSLDTFLLFKPFALDQIKCLTVY